MSFSLIALASTTFKVDLIVNFAGKVFKIYLTGPFPFSERIKKRTEKTMSPGTSVTLALNGHPKRIFPG
jgi:hypothetical protein